MKERLKFLAAAATVLLLLPCVLTVLLSGRGAVSISRDTDLEGYVAACTYLAAPFAQEEEMLKAQAVLMRSQLYRGAKQGTLEGGQLKDVMVQMQKLQGIPEFDRSYRLCRQAAEATKDQILAWQGELCPGAFHYLSAGITRDGTEVLQQQEYGYLKSVESQWDIQSPDYLSGKTCSLEELSQALGEELPGLALTEEDLDSLKAAKLDGAGYVLEMQVKDELLPGETFAQALGLSSSCFTVQVLEDKVRFMCKGMGHGLGMSQYGAQQMAIQGASYEEILKTYFPEAEIQTGAGV